MNRSFLKLISILSLLLLILLKLDLDLDTYNYTPRRQTHHSYNNTYGTALCCIAIDEEAYIDEFVDYHHALGFDSVHVYDNSDENSLKQWGEEKGNHVTVVHYPGIAKKRSAYLDCAKKRKEDGNYTWVAFFDIDEFLILKKHENIEDFLQEHLSSGALSINWFSFLSGRIAYSPLPVTKRFLYREKNVNVKSIVSIVRLRDMNMNNATTAHNPFLVNGIEHDTNGKSVVGPFNPSGTNDVAVIHNYHTKSYKELVAKYKRGRAGLKNDHSAGTDIKNVDYTKNIDDTSISVENVIFDDTAWLKVKKYVPEYALFDSLEQTQNSYRARFDAKNNTYGTAICCIAIGEEAYIDEFVDYHHALGFDSIHVYDNSVENSLKQWGEEKGNHVTVVHYPGRVKQRPAYLDCAKKRKEDGNYTWVAFFDIDEFLILKKHENIKDFLLEHLSSGALSINWLVFRTCGRIAYSPLPVTKRFLYRENFNQHVKSIVRLRDMNMKRPPHPHHPYLVNGTQHDTNGKRIVGPFNPTGPIDVAVIYHYHTKSYREVIAKYTRGRANKLNGYRSGTGPDHRQYKDRIDKVTESYKAAIANPKINDHSISAQNMIFDDTAWLKVKTYVPEYALFDALP